MRKLFVLALASMLAMSCSDDTNAGDGDGSDAGEETGVDAGKPKRDAGSGSSVDAGYVDPCSDEAKLVYLVDSDYTFYSFNPAALDSGDEPFTDLGALDCPADSMATPFSMSVDRSANAWVLYSDGSIFKVDTKTLECSATDYTPDYTNLYLFGMGFASNSSGSEDETLYIAGNSLLDYGATDSVKLASMSTSNFSKHTIGTIAGSPELTGTGDAKLWGFFPDTTPPKVSQIDKETGDDVQTFTASSIAGSPEAWAFAFWGGDFWIFLKRTSDTSTKVYRMSSSDGRLETAIANTGKTIVGAGVSTCAPVTIN